MSNKKIIGMEETARICLRIGYTPWRAVIVTSVVQAESGCDAYAWNVNDYDPAKVSYMSVDVGLCQWNTYWWIEAPNLRPTDKMTIPQMLDPEFSLRLMYLISKGGFVLSPWNTFVAGANVKHIPAARIAVRAAGGAGV